MTARAGSHDAAPVTLDHLTKALASFERSIVSATAPFDHYMHMRGEVTAFTPAQERGFRLFLSERQECWHFHGGFNFTDSTRHGGDDQLAQPHHNTGLHNMDGKGRRPEGRHRRRRDQR